MSTTIKRPLEEEELFRSVQALQPSYALKTPTDDPSGPASGSRDLQPPVPAAPPSLFTPGDDIVNFADVEAGEYLVSSYYNAQRGNDTVALPTNQAAADAIGYDSSKIFYGYTGNDVITGGGLNDLVSGDDGNDRLFGNSGEDILAGGNGNDQLFGGFGNDLLYAGAGIDFIDGGAGDDIIVSTEDDQQTNEDLPNAPHPYGLPYGLARDELRGGAGNDIILATNEDNVYGEDGNDIILLKVESDALFHGYTVGGKGDDAILGSKGDDWISTGSDLLFWPMDLWNATNKALYGGYNDLVISGDGDDHIQTMIYCNATVDTGAGNDDVFVLGIWDVISMGDGFDELYLYGGACKADLGAGVDYLSIGRAAYDNPNVSEITLGGGADMVHFTTNEWLTNGDQQPLSAAPWILDFNPDEDVITQIDVTNLDDPTRSLNADYIQVIDIAGGSALIYNDPASNTNDFCFARFSGVDADALQAHIDLNTAFV